VRPECSFLDSIRMHANLMVPTAQINFHKETSTPHFI
jgi:hypothetical protein